MGEITPTEPTIDRTYPPLPTTLSGLINLAVGDARALDRSQYKPWSGVWHCYDGPGCRVCNAGVVMAWTLGVDPMESRHPEQFRSSGWESALYALDMVRVGNLSAAYYEFDGPDHRVVLSQLQDETLEEARAMVEHGNFFHWGEFDLHLQSLERVAHMLESVGL